MTSLYQCIAANAEHQQGILKSIVMERTRKYKADNTLEAHFIHNMNLLSNRLLNQGYNKPTLKTTITEALENYNNNKTTNRLNIK